ncbi:MAG: PAS domain S-box protein [Candidatus Cloacimonetes bacterium]|nr:PAS domain S-box protein [Candidatus Cloacimonadota bacterium]
MAVIQEGLSESEVLKKDTASQLEEEIEKEKSVLLDSFIQIYESAPIGYLLLNQRGLIISVNDTLCKLLDYSCAELFQVPFVGIIQRDDQRKFLEIYPDLYKDPLGKKLSLKLLKRDDEVFWGEMVGNHIDNFPGTKEEKVLLLGVIDITEQQKMAEQNQAVEKRFETLFSQSATGIAIADIKGNFIKVNNRFADIIGYIPEELTGINFREITYADDLEVDEKLNAEMISGKRDTFEFEKRYLHKEGYPVWIRLYSSMVRNIFGDPLYGIVSMVDIREQKDIQQQLEAANQELEEQNYLLREEYRIQDDILQSLSEAERIGSFGSFVFDVEKSKGWWSQNQYELHGYKENEIEPGYEVHLQCLHPEDRVKSELVFKNILETDISQGSFEYRIIDNHKKLRYMLTVYSVERDENGKALRITGMDQDITERKLTEKLLDEKHAQMQSLLDNTNDCILLCDKNGRHLLYNKAYAAIMKELLNIEMKPELQPHKLLEDQKAIAFWDSLHKRVLGGERFTTEYNHKLPDDAVLIMEVSFGPVFEDGEVIGFSEISRDITKRKLVELELANHKEHLEEMIQERTQKLEEQKTDLENFNRLFVGREFRIKELRDEVKELKRQIANLEQKASQDA